MEIKLRVRYPDGSVKTLDKIEDIFDPRKNPQLSQKLTNRLKYREFLKETWDLNHPAILEQWSKSLYNKKILEMLSPLIPDSKKYVYLLAPVDWGSSYWYIDKTFGTTHYLFQSDQSDYKINQVKNFLLLCESDYATEGNQKPYSPPGFDGTWFTSYIRWAANFLDFDKGRIDFLYKLLDTNNSYELRIETSGSSFKKGKILTVLSYANRAELYKKFEYNSNVIDIVGSRPWLDKDEGSVPIYGVELELSTDYTPQALIDAFPDIFAIVAHDGSAGGSKMNPYELKTIPASMRKHKRNWAYFFKSTNEDMFDTLDKHTNGMHVHIDRGAFSEDFLHLKKFCYFFTNPANTKFLLEVSERDSASMASWAAIPRSSGFKKAEQEIRSNGKKTIVNLQKTNTVEVRMFKGVVEFASIIKNIEFVDAVLNFTKFASYSDVSVTKFLDWLSKLNSSQYRTLRICLEDINLPLMTLMSAIDAVVTNGKNPKDVYNLIRDAFVEAKSKGMRISSQSEDEIILSFNTKFGPSGAQISFDNDQLIFKKTSTKFAKHSSRILSFYQHEATK